MSETTDNPYLSGNFAPVDGESSSSDLKVQGEIPETLRGRLLRIGPNPVKPDPEHHHWFLGNGMVHGVRFEGGRASWYRNRYVRDDEVVEHMGWPAVPGPRPENQLGAGVANTNVIGHAGRTYAIVEAGNLPVELTDDLETVGRSDFDGTLPGGFTAHPKRDPDTGELHAAVYTPMADKISYVVIGKDGRVRKTVDVPTPKSPMVHDCAFTERYFILLDLPVLFDLDVLTAGGQMPYKWHPENGARIGLLPRDGSADDVIWCEVDPCYVFHPMNAYDDAEGRVVLDVVRHETMFDTDMRGPNEGAPTLDRWTIDPATRQVSEQRIDDRGQEFPRHDERLIGKPYRYGYTTSFGGDAIEFGGVLKHDLQTGKSELHSHGSTRFMEAVFVPASAGAGEDEGYVLAYAHDAAQNRGKVVILDAQRFTEAPLATVTLPSRVPYGFHGNWVPDAE